MTQIMFQVDELEEIIGGVCTSISEQRLHDDWFLYTLEPDNAVLSEYGAMQNIQKILSSNSIDNYEYLDDVSLRPLHNIARLIMNIATLEVGGSEIQSIELLYLLLVDVSLKKPQFQNKMLITLR